MATRRRKILDKLGAVSEKMAEILAGQDLRLADVVLPQDADPKEPPLERLRKFKDLLGRALLRLDAQEATLCRGCGQAVAESELDAMPWTEVCRSCGGGLAPKAKSV